MSDVDLLQWIGLLGSSSQSKSPIAKVSVVEADIQGSCRLPLKSNKKPLTARSWWWRWVRIDVSFSSAAGTMGIQSDCHWAGALAVATVPFTNVIHSVEGGDTRQADGT